MFFFFFLHEEEKNVELLILHLTSAVRFSLFRIEMVTSVHVSW